MLRRQHLTAASTGLGVVLTSPAPGNVKPGNKNQMLGTLGDF